MYTDALKRPLNDDEEVLIDERDFLFGADDQRAYQKLKNRQFSRIEQGILHEPLANALDEQPDGIPVEIVLTQNGHAQLSIRDMGLDGLNRANLEALHYIGLSSKKKRKHETIGRYGMGLIGCFNDDIGVKKVEIISCIDGSKQPHKVVIDNPDSNTMPLWWVELDNAAVRPVNTPQPSQQIDSNVGLEITFYFDKKYYFLIKHQLEKLVRKCIVPVRYNGKVFCLQPEKLKTNKSDIYLSIGDEPVVHYVLQRNSFSPGWGGEENSNVSIYIRKMLVEEISMCSYLTGYSERANLPQNFSNIAYLPHGEQAIILSQRAEPTVGRDKQVRNDEYENCKHILEMARVKAMVKAVKAGRKCSSKTHEFATELVLTNTLSLHRSIIQKIKNITLDKPFHEPLVNLIMDWPQFPVFGGGVLSLNEVLALSPPHNVFAYAHTAQDISTVPGVYTGQAILQEVHYYYELLWGGHEKWLISSILETILTSVGYEVICLNAELVWDEKKLADLHKRGVIECGSDSFALKPDEAPTPRVKEFLIELKKELNQSWFRKALTRFNPPATIYIVPVKVKDTLYENNLVACVLKRGRRNELHIGLNCFSTAIQCVMRLKFAIPGILPLLVHELSHRPPKVLAGDPDEEGHSPSFYARMVHLGDQVMHASALRLLGEDEGGDAGGTQVLVL